MKSVGQLLHQARKEHQLTISELARITKIGPEYLTAIEADRFDRLPSATFTKGFITNYAKAVGVDPAKAQAIFRRDFDFNRQGKIIPRGMTNPLKNPSRFYNPKTTTLAIGLIVAILVGLYIANQLFTFTQAPTITLTSPTQEIISGPMIHISGKTTTDATITVNNQPIATNASGEFSTTLDLPPGDHTLIIKSQSRDGKTRTLTRFITVEPSQ